VSLDFFNFLKMHNMEEYEILVSATWTWWKRGEGELGVENQGRSKKSFWQETGAIGQQTPRNGARALQESKVQDARIFGSTPHFLKSRDSEMLSGNQNGKSGPLGHVNRENQAVQVRRIQPGYLLGIKS
jgi:hypothetical protein